MQREKQRDSREIEIEKLSQQEGKVAMLLQDHYLGTPSSTTSYKKL